MDEGMPQRDKGRTAAKWVFSAQTDRRTGNRAYDDPSRMGRIQCIMEDFEKAKEGFFKTFPELPHGIPDEKTFARVFSWIEPGSLLSGLQTWLMGVSGRTINIDGKTICGTACHGRNGAHIVSAWVSA
jgi:hypothetical protein